MLEIGEMVISTFIGLVGLGPASRVFTFHLLDGVNTVGRYRSSSNFPCRVSRDDYLSLVQ